MSRPATLSTRNGSPAPKVSQTVLTLSVVEGDRTAHQQPGPVHPFYARAVDRSDITPTSRTYDLSNPACLTCNHARSDHAVYQTFGRIRVPCHKYGCRCSTFRRPDPPSHPDCHSPVCAGPHESVEMHAAVHGESCGCLDALDDGFGR